MTRSTARIVLLAAALAAFAAADSAAADMSTVQFPSLDGTRISGFLLRPDVNEAHGAIVAMHGCGGLFEKDGKTLSRAREDWAQRFEQAGYVVLMPDSYTPRGVAETCTTAMSPETVNLHNHVQDLIAATTWIARQPFVDRNRIAIIGWGFGGSAVIRVLDTKFRYFRQLDVKAAIAIYPGCPQLENIPSFTPSPKPVILIGAADDWAPPDSCQALAAQWQSPITLYPGAYHNFDVPDRPVRERETRSGTVHAGTNEPARAAAISDVMALFAAALGGG